MQPTQSSYESFASREFAAINEATKQAVVAARNSDPNIAKYTADCIPDALGPKWTESFTHSIKQLRNEYGDEFDDLLKVTLRYFVFAAHDTANYLLLLTSSNQNATNESISKALTPAQYADKEGWANTLFDSVSITQKPSELLDGTVFSTYPPNHDILMTAAICWFIDAAECHAHNPKQALDILYEASSAQEIAQNLLTLKSADDEYTNKLSTAGRAGAAKRHARMSELKKWAVEKYKAGKWASANAAAHALMKDILEHSLKIEANLTASNAQRTIAEWFRKSV